MMKTPNLSPELAPSRKLLRRSKGFQIGLPYITVEDDDTIMPIKEVTANPTGMVIN